MSAYVCVRRETRQKMERGSIVGDGRTRKKSVDQNGDSQRRIDHGRK